MRHALVLTATMVLTTAACSASRNGNGFENSGGGGGGSTTAAGQGSGTMSGFTTGAGGATSGGSGCVDPSCIGSQPQGNCDTSLVLDSSNAMDGARAIGLCKTADTTSWGVVSAEWIGSDGQPLTGAFLDGKGILDHFGNKVKPREGQKMLALSSGAARNPTDPGFQDPSGYCKSDSGQGAPPGYPKESPSCPGVTSGDPHDSAGLRVKIKTPTDAKSLSYDLNFFTYEYPDWICSKYNDFFVALMNPKPASLPDENISFDSMGNNISVNAGFLQSCNPSDAGGKQFSCPLGYSEIDGTGFDSNQSLTYGIQGSASTSWLNTKAPIESPGSTITIDFLIWDSGDCYLDSTVLVDNFRFELTETQTGTAPVPK